MALSTLVFDRTGSPAWAATTYAMTILPNLAGGALLSHLAGAILTRANLENADLPGADLTEADLPVTVRQTRLRETVLTGANLTESR